MDIGLTLRLIRAKEFCYLIALISFYDFIGIQLGGFTRKNNLFISNLKSKFAFGLTIKNYLALLILLL